MARSGLLELLGLDEHDPKVAAGRAIAAKIADVVETLVRARLGRKITQTAVAREMETTQSAVSNFERIGGDPKLSTILRYAHAIGANVTVGVSFSGAERQHRIAQAARAGQTRVVDSPPGLYIESNNPSLTVAAR